MKRPPNLKVGDKFRVIEGDEYFHVGEIISLEEDDGSDNPWFWKEDKSKLDCIHFSSLKPLTKSVRDAQVGDVVANNDGGDESMILERWQNTVFLSYSNDFKRSSSSIITFDELERYYTLKAEPEVVDEKLAEAIRLLKEAGYKIVKE